MEDLENEPEEIPMEDVLAEIRQILSAEVKDDKMPEIEKTAPVFVMPKIDSVIKKEEPVKVDVKPDIKVEPKAEPQPIKVSIPEIFVLTPAMRCDIPVAKAMSQNVQKQTQKVLSKLQKDTVQTDTLSPELITWLNKNLPDLIEKTVKERFS